MVALIGAQDIKPRNLAGMQLLSGCDSSHESHPPCKYAKCVELAWRQADVKVRGSSDTNSIANRNNLVIIVGMRSWRVNKFHFDTCAIGTILKAKVIPELLLRAFV